MLQMRTVHSTSQWYKQHENKHDFRGLIHEGKRAVSSLFARSRFHLLGPLPFPTPAEPTSLSGTCSRVKRWFDVVQSAETCRNSGPERMLPLLNNRELAGRCWSQYQKLLTIHRDELIHIHAGVSDGTYTIHPVWKGNGHNMAQPFMEQCEVDHTLPDLARQGSSAFDCARQRSGQWPATACHGNCWPSKEPYDAGRMTSPPERLNWLPAVEMPVDWWTRIL